MMRSTTWNSPVTVDDPETGLHRTVASARQARALLHGTWPRARGSRYRDAERACEAALEGLCPPQTARKAFIAAAIEAHLHLS